MKHRRSKLEVYIDVLRAIKKGIKKPTRIMYESNLSWKPLQNTLVLLEKKGFILEYEPNDLRDKRTSKCYMLTQKGENVITFFNKAKDFLEIKATSRIIM
jgi:predicted transcriptional regulator